MQDHVVVSLEHRFYEFNGRIYTALAFDYSYWKQYLEVFSAVSVFARVSKVKAITDVHKLADGPNVCFLPVPFYRGPTSFFIKLPLLLAKSFITAYRHQRFILRSGNVSNLLWLFLIILRRPYLREYPGSVKAGVMGFIGNTNLLSLTLAYFLDWLAKNQAKHAIANSFVSQAVLKLYKSEKPSFVFSSFSLGSISTTKKTHYHSNPIFHVISVGRLEREKGHEYLLQAISLVGGARITLIGDGTQREHLEDTARRLGIEAKFTGTITVRERLFEELKSADLFALPSLTEGMPRALLEAMALGMPCIATNAGGIPEVLDSRFLANPGDAKSLANLIEAFAANEPLRRKCGMKNVDTIKTMFDPDEQKIIRNRFWSCLK